MNGRDVYLVYLGVSLQPFARAIAQESMVDELVNIHTDTPDTPLPSVVTHIERASNGVWDLTVAFPFCGDAHLHGGGRDAHPDLGLCLSHCLADGLVGSYVLIAGPADMVKPKPKSGAWRVARASR